MAKHSINLTLEIRLPTSNDRKLDIIMADLTALTAAVSQVSTEIGDAVAALEDLKTKVEAGTVQQADIDNITATLTSAGTTLDTAVDTNDPDLSDEPPVEPAPTEMQ